jgi:Flp pilus assembly protein TadG
MRDLGQMRVEDRGSLSLLMIALVVALMGAVGLVVDGGAKIRAAQEADAVAAEAARFGGQQIVESDAIARGRVRAHPVRAKSAALSYLRESGFQGAVRISNAGRRITVHTSQSVSTIFLGLLGLHTMEVSGRAEAELVHRVGS